MIRDLTYMGEEIIPAPLHGAALRYTPLPKARVDAIAVHHWTGFTPPETWTVGEEIAYILRIDAYHRTGRGLDGIGYHLTPFASGRVYIVSRLDCYGAHVGGENDHLIGVGLPGTFNVNLPTARHLEATAKAVRYVYGYLGREVPTLPHLNWGGTTCPGDRWREWVPQLQKQAKEDEMLDPMKDLPTFIKMLESVLSHKVLVRPFDEGTDSKPLTGVLLSKTPPHTLGAYLKQLRDLQVRVDKHLKP